jgi:hypothetical protein
MCKVWGYYTFKNERGVKMIFKHKSTEEGDVTRSYLLWFEDGEENEYSVGVTTQYSVNADFEEITNFEFLDGCSNLNKEQREEIESWIEDNRDKLTEMTE